MIPGRAFGDRLQPVDRRADRREHARAHRPWRRRRSTGRRALRPVARARSCRGGRPDACEALVLRPVAAIDLARPRRAPGRRSRAPCCARPRRSGSAAATGRMSESSVEIGLASASAGCAAAEELGLRLRQEGPGHRLVHAARGERARREEAAPLRRRDAPRRSPSRAAAAAHAPPCRGRRCGRSPRRDPPRR